MRKSHFSRFKEWKQFGKRMSGLAKARDYRGMATLHYEIADFFELHGKEGSDMRDSGYRMMFKVRMKELEQIREFDPQLKLKVLVVHDACSTCKQQNDRIVYPAEAQSQRVLPVKGCDRKHGCRCAYAPQFESRHIDEWIDAIHGTNKDRPES